MFGAVQFYSYRLVREACDGVLIKGGVLTAGVVLYTSLCSWDHAWYPD